MGAVRMRVSWWLKRFYAKRFEYPEKRYINVTNYYYYYKNITIIHTTPVCISVNVCLCIYLCMHAYFYFIYRAGPAPSKLFINFIYLFFKIVYNFLHIFIKIFCYNIVDIFPMTDLLILFRLYINLYIYF